MTNNEYTSLSTTLASSSVNGLMSSTDKAKLDGIANNATAYTHPTFTAITGAPTAAASPAFGGSFTVTQVSRDTNGHVSSMTNRSITIPSTLASSSATGLINSATYNKINNMGTQVTYSLSGTTLTIIPK